MNNTKFATARISTSRMTGDGVTDEENVMRAGFRDMGEYWDAALSEPMRISAFVHLLTIHLFGPPLVGDGPLYKLELVDAVRDTAALLEGDDEDMSWEIYHQRAMIPPRQLAQTLLRQPMCQHLVPESLEAFITGTKAATAKPNLVPE
jgi:hypothetical protein